MKNIDNPEIKYALVKSMQEFFLFNTVSQETEKALKSIDNIYSNFNKELVEVINSINPHYITDNKVTVEITTKKKGRVLIAGEKYKDLIGKVIDLKDSMKEKVYYKQKLTIDIWKNENTEEQWVINASPKRFCCQSLQEQFRYCHQHGPNCEDYFIKYNLKEFTISAKNAMYTVTNCPFCGKLLKH